MPPITSNRIGVRLHGYRLVSARAKQQAVSCFVGTAEYDLVALTTDDQRRAFLALCRFAEWRGAGATASGGCASTSAANNA